LSNKRENSLHFSVEDLIPEATFAMKKIAKRSPQTLRKPSTRPFQGASSLAHSLVGLKLEAFAEATADKQA
jgi:hypothetical protein